MTVGDKVKILCGTFIDSVGVIEGCNDVYYVVKLADGTLTKFLPQEVELVIERTPNTITITREDFENAVKRVTTPSVYVEDITDYGMLTALCLSGEIVCKKLAKELFGSND